MASILEALEAQTDRPLFICDFSPPRGHSPDLLEPARSLSADFVSVAYNPGRSTRVSSVIAAHWIKANTGRDVVFTLATRDMNKVAIQSLLLGAQLLGLENLVVVKGDDFTESDLARVASVDDYTPTGLVRSIAEMNEGVDFKGLRLRSATDLCVGATFDLARDFRQEVALTRLKVDAGAMFFISQPTFSPEEPAAFLGRYRETYGGPLAPPVFFGVQVMTSESIQFGDIPQWVTDDLGRGRSGVEIALQVLGEFRAQGFRSFYLVPPIMRGGRRDYEAAEAVLQSFLG